MQDISNHYSVAHTSDISEICLPVLSALHINYFEYYRVYNDGGRALLCTHRDRFCQMIQSEYRDSTEFHTAPDLQTGYHLWHNVVDLLQTQKAKKLLIAKQNISREEFNIDNGLCIIKNYKEYIDCYNFATYRGNTNIIYTYFNHKDFFEKFIYYFKEKAHSHIINALQNKFFFPSLSCKTNKNVQITNGKYNIPKIKSYWINEHTHLTHRELQCIQLLAHGKRVKQIAQILGLSPRTVESLIKNAKHRLCIYTTTKLLDFYWSTDLATIDIN